MKFYSTREAAKKLGLHFTTLAHYLAGGKLPKPKMLDVGSSKLHAWTDAEIEHVRQLLPKIANGRRTRYKKQLAKTKKKTQARVSAPQKKKK